jgi:hypothetical protein
MNTPLPSAPISPLRQRLIDDMNLRRFSPETQRNYLRDVGRFASPAYSLGSGEHSMLCRNATLSYQIALLPEPSE